MQNILKFFILLITTFNLLFSKELIDTSLQLKWKYQFQFAGFIMAKEKGFYEDVGLNVTLKEIEREMSVYEEVQASHSDFAVGDSTIVYEFMKNTSLVAMMAILQESLYALMVREDSGIKEVQDLQNKKIALGYKLNGISLETMLRSNKIHFQDVEKNSNDYLEKFINRDFDAMRVYLSNEPFILKEKDINVTIISPKKYGFSGYGDILFTSQKMIDKHPEVVKKFYIASKKGWEYALSHIDESVETILEKYNTQNKSKEALLYEANIIKSVSGYGKNFGELNEGRLQGLAQILSYINIGKYDNENFKNSIYSLNQIDTSTSKFNLITYLKSLNPLYGSILIFFIVTTPMLVVLWIYLLKIKNRELQHILDASITGMAIFENGKCTTVNQVGLKQMGYSLDEIKGKTFFEFVPKSEHQKVFKKIKPTTIPYETLIKKKDGSSFFALTKSTKINAHKRISSFIDITTLKETQKDLENLASSLEEKVQIQIKKNREQELILLQQSRLAQMGEIINMIAHQWRQPLSVSKNLIFLTNHTLSKNPIKNKSSIENLQQISKLINYMSETINDFGTFFKPRKEKILFDLEQKIEESIALLKSPLRSQGIQIHTDYQTNYELLGYPNELGQVIINILKNSKDAFVERNQIQEKHIYLSLLKEKNEITINIEDTAGGIDDAFINYVFDPYFSTKKAQDGTGIGLYMSKLIVEKHMKGWLSVKNGTQGAIFTIKFTITQS